MCEIHETRKILDRKKTQKISDRKKKNDKICDALDSHFIKIEHYIWNFNSGEDIFSYIMDYCKDVNATLEENKITIYDIWWHFDYDKFVLQDPYDLINYQNLSDELKEYLIEAIRCVHINLKTPYW